MVIFPVLTILITAIITRRLTKTWLSPGAFFAISWSFFLMVPISFAPDYKIDLMGIWFIVILAMACAAGSIIACNPSRMVIPKRHENRKPIAPSLIQPLVFFSTISIVGLLLLFSYATNTYSFGYYANNWMLIPNLIAVDRYSGDLSYPFIIKYSLYCIYPANLMGGFIMGMQHFSNRVKILSVFPLLLAILLGIMEGARSGILLGLVLFVSSWMSTFMLKDQLKPINNIYLKLGFGMGAFIIGFTGFFILIQWLRQGMDTMIADLLMDRVRAYFFGYLSAFTQWFGTIDSVHISGILTTFAGPFNFFGIMERSLGFYAPVKIVSGVSTNIFTAFRGIIVDFSIPGSIIIAFLIGFCAQLIYQSGISRALINTLPISMFYAFTLYSPLISIFHYNSILFSWVIVLIIFIFQKNRDIVFKS